MSKHNGKALDEKALRQWFARAVPVPVTFREVLEPPETAGQYLTGDDVINVLRPGDPTLADLTFLGVLAHEAAHATKHESRLNRNSIHKFEDWLSLLTGDLRPLEETTADVAAAQLGAELGFDVGSIATRAELNLEAAPDHYKPRIREDARRAVEWLKARAATVDSRPFEDDLKVWAEAA